MSKTTTRPLTNKQTLVLTAILQYRGKAGITIRDLFEQDKFADKMEWPSHYWSKDFDKAVKAVRNCLYQLADKGYVGITERTRREGHLFWVADRKGARAAL